MKKTIIVILVGIAVFLVYAMSAQAYFLTLTDWRSGQVYLEKRVEPGYQFSLQFQHSMYDVPQWEQYRIDVQYQMVLSREEFGSGQAADYYEHIKTHATYDNSTKKWVIDVGQIIPKVNYVVPMKQDMRLNFPDEVFILAEHIKHGTSVVMKVTTKSLWNDWLRDSKSSIEKMEAYLGFSKN
ncbi:MAG: hypothetical protein QMC95_05190 [Desulfitobacteriaceae bacterium]|nr:hypothetical protein [Desulfitobacteriaceae bacterium]MDI6913596.1 hypothetical protein [Desulfitobacteriaceae bacterium]